jgi:hypothetical protein
MTIAAVAIAASAAVSAKASYEQGKVAEEVGKNNATMAEYAAQDAQRRGEEQAAAVQRRGASIKSAQRVSMASKGLDLGYGTAADLQDQTDFFTQSDVATTRYNAKREAWNLRAQGTQAEAMGKVERYSANMQAAGSLLSGAGAVASRWNSFRTPPPTGAQNGGMDRVGGMGY